MTASGFDNAFRDVQKLAHGFRENYDFYIRSEYSEAQARLDFIDKFFVALGWDVNNKWHPNPFEQEVKVEHSVSTGAANRRADYAFFVAPNFRDERFVTEAKKPAKELVTSDNYFQAVRYGWNLSNPVSGLTDFENFHLLDCRYEPDIDTALHRCLEKWTLADYCDRDKFSRLYWLISHEGIHGGFLEKYVAELPRPRGGAKQQHLFPGAYRDLDSSFLERLDGYRLTLARAFKNRHPELNSDMLTEVTQRTIDRLVFMRFLEDKLIEPKRFVQNFGTNGSAWQDFVAQSRRLDATYNGIVFKKHGLLDAREFHPDEYGFAKICEDISHKNSPYDFNTIPIHILGSIYERFLGNVIVATDKRVKIEPKAEVRKAGGVYYTPRYVVRYIVENTVGKVIEGRSPDEIAQMRFADIACGSGSFLIDVYDLLLRYHSKWYNDHPRSARKNDCMTKDGVLHLSLDKKREILLNNLYGADIDHQAVEVTQLSLYLKLLDEETIGSTHGYFQRRMSTVLPPLGENIVCGNSLIGRDVAGGNLFSEEDDKRLNAMDFKSAFPAIMQHGGFDVLLGNPPWGADFQDIEKRYFDKKYRLNAGKYESYVFFVESASRILRHGGRLGMILPSYWVSRSQTSAFRGHLLTAMSPETFIVLPENVFRGVTMDSCIFTGLKNGGAGRVGVTEIMADELKSCEQPGYLANRLTKVAVSDWKATPRAAFNPRITAPDLLVIRKIEDGAAKIADFMEFTQGLTLYRRSTLTKQFGAKKAEEIVSNRLYHSDHRKDATYKKELLGRDVARYFVAWNKKSWVSYGPWLAHAVDEKFFQGARLVVQKLRNPTLMQRLVVGYLDDDETYSAGVLLNGIRNGDSDVDILFVVSFRQACMNHFGKFSILAAFAFWEDGHGWKGTSGGAA